LLICWLETIGKLRRV